MTKPAQKTEFQKAVTARGKASFGAIKVITRDSFTCLREIRDAVDDVVIIWSAASGIATLKVGGGRFVVDKAARDPTDFAQSLDKRINGFTEKTTVVISDMDFWLDEDPIVRRHIVEATQTARDVGHLLIFLSRHEKQHAELADEISVLRHALPTRDATRADLTRLAKDNEVTIADENAALDAVQGLTSARQADAFALGVGEAKTAQRDTLNVSVLRRYKEAEIAKLDYLKVAEPTKNFQDLLGHGYLKTWLRRRQRGFSDAARAASLPPPKGMLLVGPPGTGKSRFAEATAAEWNVPFLTLDVGSIFGSLLGESEARITEAIEIAERMAPCVLLVDEVERAFGGGGDRDGGTSERVVGKFLTWLATKTAPVFVIFTSNEFHSLPAAMIRKGRLDELFFLDFATESERKAIFDFYLGKTPAAITDKEVVEFAMSTADWSPAEIEAVVGAARYTAFEDDQRLLIASDIRDEIKKTVPVSKSMGDQVTKMRSWAKERARATEYTEQPAWAGSAENVKR